MRSTYLTNQMSNFMKLAKLFLRGSMTVVLSLMFTSPAFGASHRPTGEFANFNECPLSRETIDNCVYSISRGGSFTIGSKTVPLKNPVILQGGAEGTSTNINVLGAENGETISETSQPVPGGLLGATPPTWWPKWLQEWFSEGIDKGQTGVTATLQLASPATDIQLSTENLLTKHGTAVGLPVKIRLDNPLMGHDCYIGSSEEPIQINFTTGPSGELEGSAGKRTFNKEYTFGAVSDGRLVNATFAAPTANGCGGIFSFFIDPFVNSIFGLPSASGNNTAILEGDFQNAAASAVRESE